MTTWKTIALTRWTFVGKECLCFLICCLGWSQLFFQGAVAFNFMAQSTSEPKMVLEPKKIKSLTVSIVSPTICHDVIGLDAVIFIFWMLSFKPDFPFSSFTFINRLSSFSSCSAIRVVSSACLGYWYFSWQSLFHLVIHPVWHFA